MEKLSDDFLPDNYLTTIAFDADDYAKTTPYQVVKKMARELLELRKQANHPWMQMYNNCFDDRTRLEKRLAAAERVVERAKEFCGGRCPLFALEIELEAYDKVVKNE